MAKPKWNSQTSQAVRETTGLHPIQGAISLAEQLTIDCDVIKGAENLDLLASCLDAKIQARPLGKEAGQLVPPSGNDAFLILVNEAHPRRRKNFSAGHEMGHLLMPNYSPDRGIIRDWEILRLNPFDEEEFLCDVAAAEILMPRRHFKPRLFHEGVSIDTVFMLSGEFDVSLEAALLNVVSNCEADVAGIVWEFSFDKSDAIKAAHGTLDLGEEYEEKVEKKWRVAKAWTAGAMNEFTFLRRRSADDLSPTAQAGTWAIKGQTKTFCGAQVLKPNSGVREFYVESRGYSFWQDSNDTQKTAKVVSLAWYEEPER